MKETWTTPKMAAIKGLLALSVLLLFFSSSVLSQPLKDEDEIIHNVKLNRERYIKRRSVDQPFRITLVYLDVSKIANMGIIKQLLNESIVYFQDTLRVKYPVQNILLQRRCANDSYFLRDEQGNSSGKGRYCKNACEVKKPLCGPAHVPDKDLDVCRSCNESGIDCKETAGQVRGIGHNDTDFVMYITASTEKCDKPKTVAYAAVCQQEMSVDRPVAGFLNICPNKVANMTKQSNLHELLATFKHEIFHALGFSPSLYAFFRDHTGAPFTDRLPGGMPRYSEVTRSYIPSEKVLKKITRKDWEIRTDRNNGKVEHSVHMIVTPKVLEEAKRHFNCSTLEGAELENQGGPGTELAHWEKRLFENEGMTGAFTQNSVFSRITLALMEDTGWYTVDYRKADPLRWGQNLGCKFVKNSCKAWMKSQSLSKKSLEPYCQRLKSQKQGLHTSCSVDKTSVAMCNLAEYNSPLPLEYQYFESDVFTNAERYGGSVDYADFCPYFQGFTWTSKGVAVRGSSCIQPSNEKPRDKNYALEKYSSSNSRCFLQDTSWTKTKCSLQWLTVDWGSGCYEYKCEKDGLKVIIEGYKYTCFHAGQVLHIQMQSHDQWVHQGTIICPACKDMCYDAPITCPAEVLYPPEHSQPKPIIKSYPCSGNRFGLSGTLYSMFICILFVIFLI